MNSLQTALTSIVGLTINIFIPTMLFIGVYKNKRFRFNENTVSYLCNYHTTKKLFRIYTPVAAALMTGFFLLLIEKLFSFKEPIITIITIICAVSLTLIPFTTSNFKRKIKKRKFHSFIATVFFVTAFILIIVFQLEIYQRNFLAGVIGLLLPPLMFSSLVSSVSKEKTITGGWEITYLSLFSIWCFITAIVIIFI